MIADNGISYEIQLNSGSLRAIEYLFQKVSREVMIDPFALSAEVYQLMMLIQRELAPHTWGDTTHPKIQESLNYLNRNYRQKLSLDDIATYSGLSRFYLTRLFKQETGSTVRDYLEQVRIQHARQHLLDPTLTIADIAALVGFSEQAYFANVFKECVGQSPSAYRKSARQLAGFAQT